MNFKTFIFSILKNKIALILLTVKSKDYHFQKFANYILDYSPQAIYYCRKTNNILIFTA
jgi:hypothetical protein